MEVKKCKLIKALSCEENDSCIKVAKIMRDNKERHIVVCKDMKPIGIISSVDLVNNVMAEGKDPKKLRAKDVMVSPVHILDASESVIKAYFDMAKMNIYSCPVVENNKLIGNLALHETLRYMKEQKEKSDKKWQSA